jgi:O-antigen biosynthesis protein
MKLSIVIVNYNVKHFIDQCLHSVEKAIAQIDAEVFVVDNNSVDGSCNLIRDKYPWVELIENRENLGFSRANNQAIRKSTGKYVLVLNPDTVLEEDSLEKVLNFADAKPDTGGVGVKMIDGKGNFLPESKRALPTPKVSFYKIFGLSRLFPKSKHFARYHMGHLDKDETHQVEVLAGAFMLLRKSVLDEIGLLDETFFMYGEDIDLSYRIEQAGFKNYYFSGTTIIHYKGESTKKGSINYVMVFYNAMIIFANKHFTKKNARLFSILINLAVYFRAFLAILTRLFKQLLLPVLDAGVIFAGFYYIKPIWEQYKFVEAYYPEVYLLYVVPAYIVVWLFSIYFSGGYEKPIRIVHVLRGLTFGTLFILVVYSLLNEQMRFSRMLILLGYGWSLLSLPLIRLLLHAFILEEFKLHSNKSKRIVIVAGENESERITEMLKQMNLKTDIFGLVSPEEKHKDHYLGDVSQLNDIVRINKIDEVLFSSKDISSQQIIRKMHELSDINIDYKIAPPESLSVIGSNSIDTAGDLYILDNNSIAKEKNRRSKRLVDISLSLILLILSPVLVFFQKRPLHMIGNIFIVLIGLKSWISYCQTEANDVQLPKIKSGILSPCSKHAEKNLSLRQIRKLNLVYSKDYKVMNDLSIIGSSLRYLGT